MARTVRDTNLDTRAVRERLAARPKPYWRNIDPGCHIGYYKGKRGGSWIARYFIGAGKYKELKLGKADDVQDAENVGVLSFSQAQKRARDWFADKARERAGIIESGPYTVENAMADYIADYSARGRSLNDVQKRIDAFILPQLGDQLVSDLTSKKISSWHKALAKAPRRARTARGQTQQYRELSDDPEYIRRRQASANKVLTILKAALNHAWRNEDVPSDSAWRKVKAFRDVDAGRPQYLSPEEAARLVNACEKDFRGLVRGALHSGCRYGELIRMVAADFNPDTGKIHVRFTKSGKPRDVALTDEGVELFTGLTAGKSGTTRIFLRNDSRPWGASHQRRPLLLACKAAKIDPPISFHGLRHCYGSWLAGKQVSLQIIAKALGHADARISEKHYAHLLKDHVDNTVRENLPVLGVSEDSNVVGLKHAK